MKTLVIKLTGEQKESLRAALNISRNIKCDYLGIKLDESDIADAANSDAFNDIVMYGTVAAGTKRGPVMLVD